jgi:hypothetical protein
MKSSNASEKVPARAAWLARLQRSSPRGEISSSPSKHESDARPEQRFLDVCHARDYLMTSQDRRAERWMARLMVAVFVLWFLSVFISIALA